MTNEEILQLIKHGTGDRQQLMLQLYEQNRGMIYKTVCPFIGAGGNDADDLMQTAYFGLCEAVERYDPEKGAFISYLPHWIRAAVSKILQQGELPGYMRERIRAYKKAVAEYQTQTGEYPTDKYLQNALGFSQQQLERIREAALQAMAVSMSEAVQGHEDLTIEDALEDDRDMIGELIDRIDTQAEAAELWQEVESLDDRQAEALRLKCREDLPVREVADRMQITAGQARLAIEKGCNELQRKKNVQRIGRERGYHYSSGDLFGGGLGRFRITGESIIETAVLRALGEFEDP